MRVKWISPGRAARLLSTLAGAALLAAGGCRKHPSPAPEPEHANATAAATPAPAATPAATPASEIKAGQWTILESRSDMADPGRARQNAEEALVTYPRLDCLVGFEDYDGPAAAAALASADIKGKVKIVCFGEDEDTLKGIAEGTIEATLAQQPFELGYRSLKLLCQLARDDHKTSSPAVSRIDVPVQIVRKKTLAQFRDERKKLLATQGAPAAKPGQETYAFITNDTSPAWQIARAGVHKAEAELGVSCEFQMPSDGSPAEQTRLVESMIAKQVKGLALCPCDPAAQLDPINRACAALKHVVTAGSDAPQSKRTCLVGSAPYQSGREAGKVIREILPKGGSLVILEGRSDAQNNIERRQGLIDELAGTPRR